MKFLQWFSNSLLLRFMSHIMRIYVTGLCFPCRGKKSNLNLITMEADIRTTDYKQYLLQQIDG